MNKRGYLQISFGLLFAIVVGVFILFLAIYAAFKIMGTGGEIHGAEMSMEIGTLLNPLETGFEEGKTSSMSTPSETRIYNGCNNFGEFGRQLISVSQKSFDKWSEQSVEVGFLNKYIFSGEVAEGKSFYLFSKPFDFPFKVADLVFLTSFDDEYCFVDAPEEIEREILNLKQGNFFVEDCGDDAILVCFDRSGCDVNVNYASGYVSKGDDKVYFEGDALMYAAIFSDKDVYECQLKRVMQRVKSLSLLYGEKAVFISRQGCGSDIVSNLKNFGFSADDFEDSSDLYKMNLLEDELGDRNKANVACKLW